MCLSVYEPLTDPLLWRDNGQDWHEQPSVISCSSFILRTALKKSNQIF